MRKFSVVYADPPWAYTDKHGNGGAANHYDTLDMIDICALPVRDIVADDACLFLWATMPLLPQALKVIDSWGFTFKSSAFTWLKTYNRSHDKLFFGLGRWTRANVEMCLLATRGKPERIDKGVFSVIQGIGDGDPDTIVHPMTRHSAKPPEARERIVKLMGDVPRVELFARERSPGWVSIGNEIDGRDVRAVLSEVAGFLR